ncbi:hypothetical protein [Woodsholea maritima]|uniref:hypothetical protein n=1 Tax=Woodsholea maritima TaxID=240237 RepID=UPI000366E2E1|nr:hypothetical protein [Woodsholea maritima]
MVRHISRHARKGRIAALTGPELNVADMELASRVLADHGFRLALVAQDRGILRTHTGSGEINFVVSDLVEEVDLTQYEGLVLLESAAQVAKSARELAEKFLAADKAVMALAQSVEVLADLTKVEVKDHPDVAMAIHGTLYAASPKEGRAHAVEVFAEQVAA